MNNYHRQTAYTSESLGGHNPELWGIQPDSFKRYRPTPASAPGPAAAGQPP